MLLGKLWEQNSARCWWGPEEGFRREEEEQNTRGRSPPPCCWLPSLWGAAGRAHPGWKAAREGWEDFSWL